MPAPVFGHQGDIPLTEFIYRIEVRAIVSFSLKPDHNVYIAELCYRKP